MISHTLPLLWCHHNRAVLYIFWIIVQNIFSDNDIMAAWQTLFVKNNVFFEQIHSLLFQMIANKYLNCYGHWFICIYLCTEIN